MDNEMEFEINLRDMLYRVLMQWRVILRGAVIIGLLLFGYKLVTGLIANLDPETLQKAENKTATDDRTTTVRVPLEHTSEVAWRNRHRKRIAIRRGDRHWAAHVNLVHHAAHLPYFRIGIGHSDDGKRPVRRNSVCLAYQDQHLVSLA